MAELVRQQRWLQWRNVDESGDPVCPAFGCVELVGYESVGAKIILQGRSATAFDREPNTSIDPYTGDGVYQDNRQGAQWNHAFNDHVAVMPGEIGHCTFDLPTWAAVYNVDNPGSGFGQIFTLGNFAAVVPQTIQTQVVQAGKSWYIGQALHPVNQAGVIITDEAGWNVYHQTDFNLTGLHQSRAFIGGARTFLRAANSFNG